MQVWSPAPAEWVKDLALVQLQLGSQPRLGSDPLGLGSPYATGWPKKKKEDFVVFKGRIMESKKEELSTRGSGLPYPCSLIPQVFLFGYNLRSPERNPGWTANKKTEPSVLWLQRTRFRKQPGWVWKKTPNQPGANTSILALWDPEHRSQLRCIQTLEPWKLWDNKHDILNHFVCGKCYAKIKT